MSKVTWTKSGDEWTEDTNTKSDWYGYISGKGTSDNLESRWANAKNSDGSYFVWILCDILFRDKNLKYHL